MLKLIFKAQDEAHVEKMALKLHDPVPEGWHLSREEALAAWAPVHVSEATDSQDDARPRRGRPRKGD